MEALEEAEAAEAAANEHVEELRQRESEEVDRLQKLSNAAQAAKSPVVKKRYIDTEKEHKLVLKKLTAEREAAEATAQEKASVVTELRAAHEAKEAAKRAEEEERRKLLEEAAAASMQSMMASSQAEQELSKAMANSSLTETVPGLKAKSQLQNGDLEAAKQRGDFFSSHVSYTEREKKRVLYLNMMNRQTAIATGRLSPVSEIPTTTSRPLPWEIRPIPEGRRWNPSATDRLLSGTTSSKERNRSASPTGSDKGSAGYSPISKSHKSSTKKKKKGRKGKGKGLKSSKSAAARAKARVHV